METREQLEKGAIRYARQLDLNHRGFKSELAKMKKPELIAYVNRLLTQVMINDTVKEASYLDHGKYESERMYEALTKALIRENKLTSDELYYWSFKNFVVAPKPASEYISISCRVSIWSREADASIVLNDKTYEVKNVSVYSHAQGI